MYNKDRRSGLYLPRGARMQAKGYSEAGASLRKRSLRGFQAQSGSPNEDINWNNYTLRQRGRMLYMSSPVAVSAVNTNRTKVVGIGLSLKCAIHREFLGLSQEAAQDWQRRTEAEFALWANKKANCDAVGMNDFAELQQLAMVSWLVSGDVFALFKRREPTWLNPYSLRIQLVEADRVSTPTEFGGMAYQGMTDGKNTANGNKIFDGVEIDKSGMVVAYHIRNTYPFQITDEPTIWKRVAAYGPKTKLPNILHIMNSERPDQYRGVTYLAQAIEPILQMNRYVDASLMGAIIQTMFTAWITTEGDASKIPVNEVGEGSIVGSSETAEEPVYSSPNEYQMGSGLVNVLKRGEGVTFSNPNIPVANFESFVKTLCKLIGAGTEIPYDVLIKEYNSSYSAARGALQDAWEAFQMRRRWFVSDFCQPVYELWLAEAVARGRIKAPGFFEDPMLRAAWCGAQWIGPVQASLDPLKEAKAAVLQIQEALKTREQVTREIGGGDWTLNAEQLQRENEALAAAACNPVKMTVDPNEKEEGEDDETEA